MLFSYILWHIILR